MILSRRFGMGEFGADVRNAIGRCPLGDSSNMPLSRETQPEWLPEMVNKVESACVEALDTVL